MYQASCEFQMVKTPKRCWVEGTQDTTHLLRQNERQRKIVAVAAKVTANAARRPTRSTRKAVKTSPAAGGNNLR